MDRGVCGGIGVWACLRISAASSTVIARSGLRRKDGPLMGWVGLVL